MSELQSYDTVKSSSSSSPGFFRGWWYPYSVSGTDTKTILDNSGLVALTNALVYKHRGMSPTKALCHLNFAYYFV